MSRYTTTLQVGDAEDVPVTVHFDAVPLHRGSTDGRHGPKLEPDEPAHIEIDWVELPDGRVYDPTSRQERALEAEIGEWLDGQGPTEPEDRP